MKENQTHEEVALRDRGFELVRSRDGRFVVTDTASARQAVQRGLATAPHATADEAWKATHKRVILSH